MGWHTIFLLILITLTGLFSFLILSLNSSIVIVDLLFYEIEIRLGSILLLFFITGIFITMILEIFYFLKKKRKKGD